MCWSLSWSPSFCEAAAERTSNRAQSQKQDPQCGGRPFAFVVHGLWPQYEHGFQPGAEKPAPRIDRALIDGALDMMPSPGLVIHEWRRHGTCSGLSAAGYFNSVHKARAKVTVPALYRDLDKPMMVAPGEVANAFIKANAGLSQMVRWRFSDKQAQEVQPYVSTRICRSAIVPR